MLWCFSGNLFLSVFDSGDFVLLVRIVVWCWYKAEIVVETLAFGVFG